MLTLPQTPKVPQLQLNIIHAGSCLRYLGTQVLLVEPVIKSESRGTCVGVGPEYPEREMRVRDRVRDRVRPIEED